MVNKIQPNNSLFEKCLCHLHNEIGMNLLDASLLFVLSNLLDISVISTITGFPEGKNKEYNTSQEDE